MEKSHAYAWRAYGIDNRKKLLLGVRKSCNAEKLMPYDRFIE